MRRRREPSIEAAIGGGVVGVGLLVVSALCALIARFIR